MKTILRLAILLVLGAAFLRLAADLPFGEPARTDMDDHYIAHGQQDTGANNIVTGIVFDYRAFDTLGEATVLFVAVLGVGALFRKLKDGEEYGND